MEPHKFKAGGLRKVLRFSSKQPEPKLTTKDLAAALDMRAAPAEEPAPPDSVQVAPAIGDPVPQDPEPPFEMHPPNEVLKKVSTETTWTVGEAALGGNVGHGVHVSMSEHGLVFTFPGQHQPIAPPQGFDAAKGGEIVVTMQGGAQLLVAYSLITPLPDEGVEAPRSEAAPATTAPEPTSTPVDDPAEEADHVS